MRERGALPFLRPWRPVADLYGSVSNVKRYGQAAQFHRDAGSREAPVCATLSDLGKRVIKNSCYGVYGTGKLKSRISPKRALRIDRDGPSRKLLHLAASRKGPSWYGIYKPVSPMVPNSTGSLTKNMCTFASFSNANNRSASSSVTTIVTSTG
jgi:hypothetical protein